MQTFLPYPDFRESARALDVKRLGKQRVETLQIMQVLLGERLITSDKICPSLFLDRSKKRATVALDKSEGKLQRKRVLPRAEHEWEREPLTAKGWRNHPAVLMWKGHELTLFEYQKAICEEWVSRGYKDTCLRKTEVLLEPHRAGLSNEPAPWLGDEDFHRSHRSNLRRKFEEHYSKLWPQEPSTLPYVWPTSAASNE